MFEFENVCNYYGMLYAKEDKGNYYWGLMDYGDDIAWSPITKALYDELFRFKKVEELINTQTKEAQ